MNKKGAVPIMIVLLVVGVIFLFGASGSIAFLFQNKTIIIALLAFIFLISLRRRR